jgi:hypothetical protein
MGEYDIQVHFVMGESRIAGFGEVYPFCHAPLDNIFVSHLKQYGFSNLPCAWSRIDDYDQYLGYQRWIRERFASRFVPLDVEFLLWVHETIDVISIS